MTGAVARNDLSVFMACTKAPNHRVNMVHRIKEELGIGETKYVLSTQEFADGTKEEGYRYLTEFSFETLPVWNYLISGVEMHVWIRHIEFCAKHHAAFYGLRSIHLLKQSKAFLRTVVYLHFFSNLYYW